MTNLYDGLREGLIVDPDYVEQPCCGMKVHVDDLGSGDETQHVDCPLFPDE
tara:strand:- start:51 stop:203 length:153 start_codon:yes stop_codon:yes gene_type:complete